MRTGTAYLPLHYGNAPRWLFNRMVDLSGAISEFIITEYGQQEFLKRISDPCWFQAFGCVLGFDWHSSGLTTTTCGALKISLNNNFNLGIKVCGGKGKTSRKTPDEIKSIGAGFGLSTNKIDKLVYASKMSAKVDTSCVQDDYQLYHHCFFVSEKGEYAVVQQGMSDNNSTARRYHWLNETNFVDNPEENIAGEEKKEEVLNLVSESSKETRKISTDLIKENPEKLLKMPLHHPIYKNDLAKRDLTALKKAYELQPKNYEELVALHGMGPKKLRALALISNLIYGSDLDWEDPIRFSFAHGGKDGFPFPVHKKLYDENIDFLKNAIADSKIENKEKQKALKRLTDLISN